MELTKNQEIILQVIEHAWNDVVFKKELVSSPIKTIEKFTGEKFEIGDAKSIKFVDRTADSSDEEYEVFELVGETLVVNIPPELNLESIELSEEQLEAISGGNPFGVELLKGLDTVFNGSRVQKWFDRIF